VKKDMVPNIFDINITDISHIDTHEVKCLLCQRRDITSVNSFVINGQKFNTVRCLHDGMMWLDPQPSQSFYDYIYSKRYHNTGIEDPLYEQATLDVFDDPVALQNVAEMRMNDIERFAAKGRFLEVGFGAGYTLKEAQRRGWETYGIETEERCIREIQGSGINAIKGDFLDQNEAEKYDVIAMYSVIEHILDPETFLRKASSLLRKNGLLVLRLPDTGVQGPTASLIAHVFHFNAHTVLVFLRHCGFEPICIDGFGLWKPRKYPGGLWNMNVYSKRTD
jgi:2-polyprenyl-3-methyl-5-hydroxy-6-metoxy-1,4-benzoquinol methylase